MKMSLCISQDIVSDFWSYQSNFSNGDNLGDTDVIRSGGTHTYSAWICHFCFSVNPVCISPIGNANFLRGFFRGQNPAWKEIVLLRTRDGIGLLVGDDRTVIKNCQSFFSYKYIWLQFWVINTSEYCLDIYVPRAMFTTSSWL